MILDRTIVVSIVFIFCTKPIIIIFKIIIFKSSPNAMLITRNFIREK
jgi:hypothetical protein